MLFLNTLSLLYIMHYVACRTFSESEKVNEMIGSILLKTELKNLDPVQHLLKKGVKEIERKRAENINIFDQVINPSVRVHNNKMHSQDPILLPERKYEEPIKNDWLNKNGADIKLSTGRYDFIRAADDVKLFEHYLEPSPKSDEKFSDTLVKEKNKYPFSWNNIKFPEFKLTTHFDVTLYTEKNLNLNKYHFHDDDSMKYIEKLLKDQNTNTETKQFTSDDRKYSYDAPTTDQIFLETSPNMLDHNPYLMSDSKKNSDFVLGSQKNHTNPTSLALNEQKIDDRFSTQNNYETGESSEHFTSHDNYDEHSLFDKFFFVTNVDDQTQPTFYSWVMKLDTEPTTEHCTETTTAEDIEITKYQSIKRLTTAGNEGHEFSKSPNAKPDGNPKDNKYQTRMTENYFDFLRKFPKSRISQNPETFTKNEQEKFDDKFSSSEKIHNPISTEHSDKTKVNIFESDRQKLSDVLFNPELKNPVCTKLFSNEKKQKAVEINSQPRTEKLKDNAIEHEKNLKDFKKKLVTVISEKNNSNKGPIKSGNGKIYSNAELNAQENKYKMRNEKKNLLQHSEQTKKNDDKKSSSKFLRLKDIISDFDRLTVSHVQENDYSWRSYADNLFVKMKTEGNYKQKVTRPLPNTETTVSSRITTQAVNDKQHDDIRSKMFSIKFTDNPLPKTGTTTAPTTLHLSDNLLYQDLSSKTWYKGSAENEFTVDTTETASKTSKWIEQSTNQEVLPNIDAPIQDITTGTKGNIDITVPNTKTTPFEQSFKHFYENFRTTTDKNTIFDYSGSLKDFEEPTFKIPKVTAKQWGILNSMEERVDRIPNYVNESFEDIVKKIADDVAPTLETKNSPSISYNNDNNIEMKRVTDVTIIGREPSLPYNRITTITIEGCSSPKMVANYKAINNHNRGTPKTPHNQNVTNLKEVTQKTKLMSAMDVADLLQKQNINDLYKEIMKKYEKITPFEKKRLSKFDKIYQQHLPKGVSIQNNHKDTEKENQFNVQEEHQTQTEQKFNKHSLPQKQHEVDLYSENVDSKINDLYKEIMRQNGFIPSSDEHTFTKQATTMSNTYKDLSQDVNVISAEKPLKPKSPYTNNLPEDANVPQEIFETYTPKKYSNVKSQHQETSTINEFNDLYKDFMEKYGNLTSMNTDESKTKKLQKKIMKLKNRNWERFKKFFVKKSSQVNFEYTPTEM